MIQKNIFVYPKLPDNLKKLHAARLQSLVHLEL